MKRSLATPMGSSSSEPFVFKQAYAADIHFSSALSTPSVKSQINSSPAISPSYEGPFQVIEPGSDLYIDMGPDFDYCVDAFGGIDVMEQQELFISENGIPQEILDDVFRLDDEIELAGGTVPKQYPVADGLSLKDFENQLVAEMEGLFPEAQSSSVPLLPPQNSRLMEELVKKNATESPCYMSVQLRGRGLKNGHKALTTAPRDLQRGYRCVEMVDGSGSVFKAKYYENMPKQRFTPVLPQDISIQRRRVSDLFQSPTLRNVSPEMASKIENLASGKRDVTLAKIRPSDVKNPSTTIVIKTPKRTIASGGATGDLPPPPIDFPVPMTIIKQEPLFDVKPIEVPIITPSPASNKQPRKQKLHSLSQCDVVFKECAQQADPSGKGNPPMRKPVPRGRGRPPNDFVTVTITDVASAGRKEPPQSVRPTTSRASDTKWISISAEGTSDQVQRPSAHAYPFRKRSLVTHYRVQVTPNNSRVSGQSVESIEIVDTTDEENENGGSVASELPKLPGNTESIQCPFCCKVFFSTNMLMLHGQSCADAVLFQNSERRKETQQQVAEKLRTASKCGEIPTKHSMNKTGQGMPPNRAHNRPKLVPEAPFSKKTRPGGDGDDGTTQRRTTRRLSIEILPTAFGIHNLLLCGICKKSFRSQEHLELHQSIHRTPTVCQYCKKKFHEPPPKHNCQEMKRTKQQRR